MRQFVIVLLLSFVAIPSFADTLVVEMKRPLTKTELVSLRQTWSAQVDLLDDYKSDYFTRTYRVERAPGPLAELSAYPLVSNIESVDEIPMLFSVEPSEVHSKMSNDPLLPYQWAIENTGQVVTYDIDDITLGRKTSVPQASNDIESLMAIDEKMKKEVVVAVIDSGVDLDHPELKDKIARNTAECTSTGEVLLRPKEDKDGNGFIGDCKGWDFTGPDKTGDKPGTPKVLDDTGHGTHVSGIIAAQSNNDIGIAGISNKIKILPVKVFKSIPEKNNVMAITDRIANGILYAVKRQVNVINISFGWPTAMDKKYLREALQSAIDSNIVVVAAAGNNNHSALIMPCAISGVLCVGAVDNRYTVSDFSNFGLHVDVLAPGDNILSTYPMSKASDLFSAVRGYDIMSGTSQAAPYVSALAGVLAGMDLGLNAEQIANRIRLSSRKIVDPVKNFLTGVISYKNAINGDVQDHALPEFKERATVIYKLHAPTNSYELKIINPSSKARGAKLSVRSLSSYVAAQTASDSVFLPADGKVLVPVEIKILDSKQDSLFNLELTLDGETYVQQVEFVRDLDDDPSVRVLKIPDLEKPNLLSLVAKHLQPAAPRYFYQTASSAGTVLSVLDVQGDALVKTSSTTLTNVNRVISFHQLDLDHDGKLDHQVIALVGKDPDSVVRYFNYDENMQPLKVGAELDVQLEGVLQTSTQLFYLYKNFGGKPMAMPFFFASGPVPKKDQPGDPFAARISGQAGHLYYFSPEEPNKLVTRIIDSPDRLHQWKKQLQMKPFSDVRLLLALPQTDEDLAANQARLVVSYGLNYDRSAAMVTMTLDDAGEPQFSWQTLDLSNRVIDGYKFDNGIDLEQLKQTNPVLIGHHELTMWEKLSLNTTGGPSRVMRINSVDPTEILNVFVKEYQDHDTRYSFVQAISQTLLIVEKGDEQKTYTRPYHVSSFLPGTMFLEKGYPIWFQDKDHPKPAVYVDATQIVARHVYLIVGDENGLQAPMEMNVYVPAKCVSLNPSLWDRREYQLTMLCGNDKTWELRLLPMKN